MSKPKKKISKIVDQPDLIRDMTSNAVINKNKTAYAAHIARREKTRNTENKLTDLQSQVEELKKIVAGLVQAK